MEHALRKDGLSGSLSLYQQERRAGSTRLLELTSSDETPAAFPFVFIVKMYNKLSKAVYGGNGLSAALLLV